MLPSHISVYARASNAVGLDAPIRRKDLEMQALAELGTVLSESHLGETREVFLPLKRSIPTSYGDGTLVGVDAHLIGVDDSL